VNIEFLVFVVFFKILNSHFILTYISYILAKTLNLFAGLFLFVCFKCVYNCSLKHFIMDALKSCYIILTSVSSVLSSINCLFYSV
jgi:hypothetical protein